MSVCEAPSALDGDFFELIPYQTTSGIKFSHNASPRFGFTNDITKLFAGTSDEKKDYLKGLLIGALVMFVFFVIWVSVLFGLRCFGPKRVGWLSGSRAPLEEDVEPMEEQAEEDDENEIEKDEVPLPSKERVLKSARVLKYVVAVSLVGIIVASIMMVSKGVPGLNSTVDSTRESLTIASGLLAASSEVTVALVTAAGQTIESIVGFLRALNGLCPAAVDNLCEDLDNVDSCDLGGIFGNELVVKVVVDLFAAKKRDVLETVNDTLAQIEDLRKDLDDTDQSLDNVDWLFHTASGLSIILIVICLVVLVGLFVRLPNRIRRIQYWTFFPLFVFLVIFAFIFSFVFILVSTGMSDACVDSPDGRVKTVLLDKEADLDPLSQNLVRHYIDQCGSTEQAGLVQFLVDGSNALADLDVEISNSTARIEEVCGETDVEALSELLVEASDQMCVMGSLVGSLQTFFRCSTWYPLYQSVVHETLCYSVDAYAWIAASQFAVVFLAMVVVTCRNVIYQDVEGDLEGSERGITEEEKVAALEQEGPVVYTD